jgi:alkanesulfonate monooxygenase SsuD/methylene tetrahydromethanopterin reductase-like flavin-dependent oxidoreductase (luciferase family)
LAKLRGYAEAAGRDPGAIGVEAAVRLKPDDTESVWAATADSYRSQGATHLKAVATGSFRSPAEQLDATLRWKAALSR